MTPANLQNALIKRIRDILKEFPLKTNYNNPKEFNVFKQNVPKQRSEYDYSEEEGSDDSLFPFVVVKLSSGTKEDNASPQVTTVQLIIGVMNEDEDGRGFDDVLACMEAIVGDLNKNPMINNKHDLKYPLTWTTIDEDTHPYYYVGLELSFESLTLTREV